MRIEQLLRLWREPVPGDWERGDDPALTDAAVRYRRTHAGRPGGAVSEALIEHQILDPDPQTVTTTCLDGLLVDGINAVSLQANRYRGGRRGNVEADMLLLVRNAAGHRAVLVEVKVSDATPWYAAVEALRQLRLFTMSAATQRVLRLRRPDLELAEKLPVTAVVLAPAAYYAAPGKKSASVADTRALAKALSDADAVDLVLATWDPERRVLAPLQ